MNSLLAFSLLASRAGFTLARSQELGARSSLSILAPLRLG